MHRLAALALPVVLAISPQIPEVAPAPLQAAVEEKIVRWHTVNACGPAPPASLAGWRKLADAIVHVRLDSQFTTVYPDPNDEEGLVVTLHEATILDLFKLHPQVMSAGTSLTILQRGGTIRRADGLHKYDWNSFSIMPSGGEWVLFLYWNAHLNAFEVRHFENGALQIQDGTIHTASGGALAERWKGQSAGDLLAALRR